MEHHRQSQTFQQIHCFHIPPLRMLPRESWRTGTDRNTWCTCLIWITRTQPTLPLLCTRRRLGSDTLLRIDGRLYTEGYGGLRTRWIWVSTSTDAICWKWSCKDDPAFSTIYWWSRHSSTTKADVIVKFLDLRHLGLHAMIETRST